MSAYVPLSDSLRIALQFYQNLPTPPNIYSHNPQQVLYPRVYLVREQPRGLYGPVPLDSVGRTQQFDMSWEEFRSLVHSKPLAMNILTFRDYTNAQNDNTRIQRGIPMYSRPSQVLLSHLQSGIAPQQPSNTMSVQNPGFTSNHVVNNTANYGYSAQNTLVREKPYMTRHYTSQHTNGSNHFMNIAGIWCNNTCCVPRTSIIPTLRSYAPQPRLSSFDGMTQQDLNTIDSNRTASTLTNNPSVQPNNSCNSSIIAGGRSSTSSDLRYLPAAKIRAPVEQQSETDSGQGDNNSDDNMGDYDFDSEVSEDEFQLPPDSMTSIASTINNLSEPVVTPVAPITSTTSVLT